MSCLIWIRSSRPQELALLLLELFVRDQALRLQLAELLDLLDRVVGDPARRSRCGGLLLLPRLLLLQLVPPCVASVVRVAAFLRPLAGVVGDAADNSGAHQGSSSNKGHLPTSLSWARRDRLPVVA